MDAKYGYGLFIDTLRGERLIHHNGSVPGSFNALLPYLPAQRVTVALLRNADGGLNLELLARQVAAFAAGRPFPRPQPTTLAAEQLEHFEGVYGQDQHSRRIRVIDGALTSQRDGGNRVRLMPVGPARFAFPEVAQLAFELDGAGNAIGWRQACPLAPEAVGSPELVVPAQPKLIVLPTAMPCLSRAASTVASASTPRQRPAGSEAVDVHLSNRLTPPQARLRG